MSPTHDNPPPGYELWSKTDDFVYKNGPMFIHSELDPPKGQGVFRMFIEDRHCNAGGAVHGGMLMTFADTSMFAIARRDLDHHFGVTMTMNNEFLYPAWPGQWLEADGEVVRATKSGIIFVRGQLFTQDEVVMTFSGIIKRINKVRGLNG